MSEHEEERDEDHEYMMDQCASECIDAIEEKDKAKFREAFEVLLGDILNKYSFGDEE